MLPFSQVDGPRWDDRPLYIIGGGDSIRGLDFSKLEGRKLGVNKSAWTADCDALVTLDQHFARMCSSDISAFAESGREAFLVLPPNEDAKPIPGATYVIRRRGPDLSLDPSCVHGVNSGFAALGIAWHKGAREIGLLGFDMQYGKTGATHWHGGYSWHGKQSHRMYDKWANGFEKAAAQFRAEGVNVVNFIGDPKSKITCFPVSSLNDLF